MFERVRLVLACFLEFLVTEDADTPKEVVAPIGHNFCGQIEAHGFEQPLPGYFVEPVELEDEGHEVDGSETVLDCPVLPLQPEQVELKGQQLGTAGVGIDSSSVGLQQLQGLSISVQFVRLPSLMKSYVPHL